MLRTSRDRSRLLADEHGFTLPEMLVAAALALMLAAVGTTMMTIALRAEPKISGRAADIAQARTLIEHIGRELRQGETVSTATGSEVTLLTYVRRTACGASSGSASTAILCRVTYTCGTTCTRLERNPDGSGEVATETVATGLSGSPVFSFQDAYSPTPCPGTLDSENPAFICIRLAFPAENGDDSVTLNDAVALRNWFDPDGAT